MTPKDRMFASGIAGGFAGGSVGALTSTLKPLGTFSISQNGLTRVLRRSS